MKLNYFLKAFLTRSSSSNREFQYQTSGIVPVTSEMSLLCAEKCTKLLLSAALEQP